MNQPVRKRLRLQAYDYGQNGVYFITVCTKDRRHILSQVIPAPLGVQPEIRLTAYGMIVEEELSELSRRFSGISLDHWVIMPNHIHLLLRLDNTGGAAKGAPYEGTSHGSATIPGMMRALKSITSHRAGIRLWQTSYFDRVIRNDAEWEECWTYIDNNPAQWLEDEYYDEVTAMKTVTLYTDGACSGNPGPGGWACILMFGPHKKELSGGEANTTNNRMELTAVIEGLKALKEPCVVELYSDSKYVIDALEQGWAVGWRARGWKKADKKPALNSDLWGTLLDLCQIHKVNLHWVKGHASNPYNNRCDQLAVQEWEKIKQDSGM